MNNLKETINNAKNRITEDADVQRYFGLEPLVELAEWYLKTEAIMPEKKIVYLESYEDGTSCCDRFFAKGYNKAINDCTIATTKILKEKDEEIERLNAVIAEDRSQENILLDRCKDDQKELQKEIERLKKELKQYEVAREKEIIDTYNVEPRER